MSLAALGQLLYYIRWQKRCQDFCLSFWSLDWLENGGATVRPFVLFSKIGQIGLEVLEHLAAAFEALTADEGGIVGLVSFWELLAIAP